MRQLGEVAQEVVEKLRRQLLVARLYRLGARPTYEFLEEVREIVPPIFHAEINERLEKYAALDAATVVALGGDRLAPPPLHTVTRR